MTGITSDAERLARVTLRHAWIDDKSGLRCDTLPMREQRLTNRARLIGYLAGLVAVAVAVVARLVR